MATHQKDFIVEHQMMIFQDNKKVQRTLLEKNKQLEGDLREEKEKNEKLKKKVEKLEERQERCNKLHQNNFSMVDTMIYWVMNSFQIKEGKIQVFGKIQLSHLIKKHFNLLERILPPVPFKFMSFFNATFVNENNTPLVLKGKEKSFREIIRNCILRGMKFHQMYQTGSQVIVKLDVRVKTYYNINFVDKTEFTELSKQENYFKNDNVIVKHEGYGNRSIFLHHPDISPEKGKLCVIRNKKRIIDEFRLIGETCERDINDVYIEHSDGNELKFHPYYVHRVIEFILLVLYT